MDGFPRGVDRHLQRIMHNATGPDEQILKYSFGDTRSAEYGPGTDPKQIEDPMLLNEPDYESCNFESSARQSSAALGNAIDREPYNCNATRQTSGAIGTAPTRLSLEPQNIYGQQGTEPNVLKNASNHLRFSQILRQGLPLNPTAFPAPLTSSSNNQQPAQSPLTQLANRMLFQRPMQQTRAEKVDIFQNENASRLTQLQPRRQETTPPMNLSGFSFSPYAQSSWGSSSPAAQPSSPTARISLRRAANRVEPVSGVQEMQYGFEEPYEEPAAPPKTPQRQIMGSLSISKYMPQRLALGHAPPMAHGIQLIAPHQLPDRFRQVFPYELFNAVQSKCFAPIYKSNDNVVVSAPTGSGKTALLELAICKLVEGHPSGQFKIVYQAPTKSLCSERMRDWQRKFSHLNLACVELTGDTGHAEMNRVGAASIIVTTPEKWDSITRKWKDYSRLLQLVKLFLIDEVHILKDTRGATLEAVVSRMKTSGANVRFVALSATVPNSQDIAVWLGKDHTNDHLPAHRETFGEDFRPVKLQKHVYGFDGLTNEFAFEKTLDGKLPNLIQKHSKKKPIMVFCFTRKSCESTAVMLAEWWAKQRVVDRSWPAPAEPPSIGNKELRELVGCGVAFHHAGLEPHDRYAIETAFLKGDVSLICCTSTLAVGVNLPCHLVILKGTVCFQNGNLCEYSDLEVMQMLGRAGRPQFDDSAVAIIMARSEKADRYKKMISGQDILESTLHLNLIEHLNSEIGLGTVHDLYTAKKWLSGTFLSVRMRQNPDYYKLDGVPLSRDVDERLELVCERDIKLLEDHGLVKNAEGRLLGTEYGQAMSRYMVQFETMKRLLSLSNAAKTGEILHLLCQATEFKDLRIKPNERSSLREFNKSPFVKFPIKENISTTAHKISLMIQAQLGGVEMPTGKDFLVIRRQFNMEKGIIFERIQRLIRCIVDCKVYKCDAVATRHALDLARSLSAEFWENSNLQLRQVPQVGPAALRKLVASDINSVDKLMSQDTATIERIMGKNPPFGRKTLDLLAGFPSLRLAAEILGKAITKAGQKPKVDVKVQLSFANAKIPVWNGSRPSVTFMAETSTGTLVHFWRGNISKLDKGFDFKFRVELDNPYDKIKCHLACDEIVGTVRYARIDPGVPASAFPKPEPTPATQSALLAVKSANYVHEDEFGTDNIGDDELLAAVEELEAPKSESDSDSFVDIDNFDDAPTDLSSKKFRTECTGSVQMENGKWTCNHHCRGGTLLKTGLPCKHKCCKEGLDKRPGPRRVRTQSSIGNGELLASSNPHGKISKLGKHLTMEKSRTQAAGGSRTRTTGKESGAMRSKLKVAEHSNSDQQNMEVVDLAEELSPMPHSIASREYRNLHTSVQKSDGSVRLPKQKPQFAYISGSSPDLPFLRRSKLNNDDDVVGSEESDGEDLPSDPLGTSKVGREEPASISTFSEHALSDSEAALLGLEELLPTTSPNPKFNSRFANGIFDFNTFDEKHCNSDAYSSPLMGASRKRERSHSPALLEGKRHRVSLETEDSPPMRSPDQTEISATLSTPVAQNRVVQMQDWIDDPQPNSEQTAKQRSVPAWVDEFDAEFIDSFMGIVDFVE